MVTLLLVAPLTLVLWFLGTHGTLCFAAEQLDKLGALDCFQFNSGVRVSAIALTTLLALAGTASGPVGKWLFHAKDADTSPFPFWSAAWVLALLLGLGGIALSLVAHHFEFAPSLVAAPWVGVFIWVAAVVPLWLTHKAWRLAVWMWRRGRASDYGAGVIVGTGTMAALFIGWTFTQQPLMSALLGVEVKVAAPESDGAFSHVTNRLARLIGEHDDQADNLTDVLHVLFLAASDQPLDAPSVHVAVFLHGARTPPATADGIAPLVTVGRSPDKRLPPSRAGLPRGLLGGGGGGGGGGDDTGRCMQELSDSPPTPAMLPQARLFVERKGHTPDDASDLAYETLLKVCVRQPGKTGEPLRAYYMGALKKNLLHFRRSRGTRSRCDVALQYHEAQRRDGLAAADTIDMRRALCRLDEGDREVLHMRFELGMSAQEVGEALDINEATARKRVSRAVERLKRHLN